MAQAAQSSHLCPAVLSIAGIAAACAAFAVYNAYTKQSLLGGLQRSNAVHRPRGRRRQVATIQWMDSTPDTPLGMVIIRRGEDAKVIDLATTPIPTTAELRDFFPLSTENMQTELSNIALQTVLSACYSATHCQETCRQIETLGFSNLIADMAARDEERIRLCAHDIPSLLHLDAISDEQIEEAVDQFLTSEKWLGGFDSGSDNAVADPAETEEMDMPDSTSREPSQGLRGLLYYIAEEDAKRKAYEHRGIHCEECGEMPIRGIRWHCLNCPDFDLCASCEMHTVHPKTHVFAKIKIPLPVLSQPTKEHGLWYPGDPRKIHAPIEAAFKKRLGQEHGFEDPQMDALYDQFTCLANVPWQADTSAVKAAIDKRAFNKALTCEKWSSEANSNALYDRMFAFYDTDGNGLIGFEEFVSGLAYLRGPKRFTSLERAIQGYDIDGDGYVDRADFLRLLRAKFSIHQQIIRDSVEGQEFEQTQSALETLRSSQPISSVFSQEDIPPGESRPRTGKQLDEFGDMQPLFGVKTLLNDDDPWLQSSSEIRSRQHLPGHERLRHHFSRFEELLQGTATSTQGEIMAQVDGISPALVSGDQLEISTADPVLLTPDEDGGFSPNSNVASALRSFSDQDDELVEPHIQDILWKVSEDGFNLLLDTIFLSRERGDQAVINTRAERDQWRKEIDSFGEKLRKVKDVFTKGSESSAQTFAAVTRDLAELNSRHQQSPDHGEVTLPSTGDLVPTDWESLERREQDIADTPLDELLDTTGYGVRDGDDFEDGSQSPRQAHIGSSSIWNGSMQNTATSPLRTVTSSNNVDVRDGADPTLPQNMPEKDIDGNEAPTLRRTRKISGGLDRAQTSGEGTPSERRLQSLFYQDRCEASLQERGGPGRLSYAEIENLTVAAGGEVRGLVKSWLEWASF